MITDKELDFVRQALDMARRAGAQQARATLSKSEEDLVATLDGEVDRVTHCADRSLSLALFVDGRYGSYSTNKLDAASLEGFIARAVAATRMVAEDALRVLPDPARCCHDALTGNELGLVDPSRDTLTPADRQRIALNASVLYASRGGSAPRQNFALRAHPSQPDGWAPPVHETTGGHGCQQQPALADKQEAEFNNYCEDAIEFLRKTEEGKYDLMIVDPPAFAKHRGALKNALRAYQRLNAAAIAKVAPGGLVFTFSCSQVVDKITFANTVFSAAAQTGRSVRILDPWVSGPVFIPLLTVILCILLVSEVPMFSFKMHRDDSRTLQVKRWTLVAFFVAAAVFCLLAGHHWSLAVVLGLLFYILNNLVYALFKI